jgi:hypothetical protein
VRRHGRSQSQILAVAGRSALFSAEIAGLKQKSAFLFDVGLDLSIAGGTAASATKSSTLWAGGLKMAGQAFRLPLLVCTPLMQVSLTIAHICNSFAFLVFHPFRVDGAKPLRRRKTNKKAIEFSRGRTLAIMFARELFTTRYRLSDRISANTVYRATLFLSDEGERLKSYNDVLPPDACRSWMFTTKRTISLLL